MSAHFENSAGSCYISPTGSSVSCTSDARLKSNLNAITPAAALAGVMQLSPTFFNWNSEASGTPEHSGFIAQQVMTIFPELVTQEPDGYYALNYAGLTPYLTGAVQELNDNFLIPASATSTLLSAVLSADGKSINLYQLATFAVSNAQALSDKIADLDTRMTSLEARVTALENGTVRSGSSSPVSLASSSIASALSGFGAFIQKGIAQFGILVADQFVAATNSAGTSSAGTVTILAGNTVAQVTNAYVNPASKIFVTLTASTTGSWYISNKQNGSFELTLSAPQTNDVSFDYFIVQTEGQIATSSPQTSGLQSSDSLPVITLLGGDLMHIDVGDTFVDPGVQVAGDYPVVTYINGMQQEVSSTTIDTSSPTKYIITYSATDAAENVVTATRVVVVGNPDGEASADTTSESSASSSSSSSSSSASSDTTPPVVTLNGSAALQINVGDTFTDPGATATDAVDPSTGSGQVTDLTAKIVETGTVDTSTAGLYTLTYTATDAAGNSASVSRVVTVVASTTSAADTSTTTP